MAYSKRALRAYSIKQDLLQDMSGPVVYAAVAAIPGSIKFVKVGFSTSLISRLQSIQTGCPVPITSVSYCRTNTVDKARAAEAAIHLLMADQRSVGEWFKFDLSSERDMKVWRGAIPAVLNEMFGKGRWKLKSFDYARAARIKVAA